MAALAELDQRFGTVLSFCMGFPASDFDECAPMVWGHGEQAEAAVAQLFKLVSEPTQWQVDILPVREAVVQAMALGTAVPTFTGSWSDPPVRAVSR